MSEENKAIIRRLYDESINKGNMSVIDEVYAHDVELHLPGIPEDPYGPMQITKLFTTIKSAFPDLRVTVDHLVSEGNAVVAGVSFRGPHQGRVQGTSGKSPMAAWARIDIYRIIDGKIVEQWADRDELGILAHVGIVPVQVPDKYAVPAGPGL